MSDETTKSDLEGLQAFHMPTEYCLKHGEAELRKIQRSEGYANLEVEQADLDALRAENARLQAANTRYREWLEYIASGYGNAEATAREALESPDDPR